MQPTGELMEATVGWSSLYSFVIMIVCFMFLLNFILAVVADNYMKKHKEELVGGPGHGGGAPGWGGGASVACVSVCGSTHATALPASASVEPPLTHAAPTPPHMPRRTAHTQEATKSEPPPAPQWLSTVVFGPVRRFWHSLIYATLPWPLKAREWGLLRPFEVSWAGP